MMPSSSSGDDRLPSALAFLADRESFYRRFVLSLVLGPRKGIQLYQRSGSESALGLPKHRP